MVKANGCAEGDHRRQLLQCPGPGGDKDPGGVIPPSLANFYTESGRDKSQESLPIARRWSTPRWPAPPARWSRLQVPCPAMNDRAYRRLSFTPGAGTGLTFAKLGTTAPQGASSPLGVGDEARSSWLRTPKRWR
ncbi:uncharacterized protein LOC142587974 isoform X2 [Dermacentor variabilis]|uniref:uncharacterized protein LOC142587974 isoform X2 n=1 Tax=Dermacentor variabilis TaxID=34621 RepID=UPI003F5AE1FE